MSLFNRILKNRSPQPNTDPHSWKLPSSYSIQKSGAKQTIIPNPRIFGDAIIPDKPKVSNLQSALIYPDVSHAAVHLALLECFWNLRISATFLDIDIISPPQYQEKPKTHSAAPTKLPESKRWDLLISLAVTRFDVWWSKINNVLNHAAAYSHRSGKDVAVQLAKEQLPPLDVLLVWYSLILNEETFDAACKDNERAQLLCFPWPAIRDCIDMEKMQYEIPRAAQILFNTLSGQSANILTYLEQPPAYTESETLSFGLDLRAEIKKQEEFSDKSHALLWIRSPALAGSLDRATASYMGFYLHGGLKSMDTGKLEIPFGVELLWRTHRLFPSFYRLFVSETKTMAMEQKETQSHGKEKLLPQQSSHQPPKICECWTCERIRDDIPTFASLVPSQIPSSSSLGPPPPSGPDFSSLSSLSGSTIRQIQDDLGFHEAVEAARRRGDSILPTRPLTPAEKATLKVLEDRQKEVGYLPGLHEYWEIQPDGSRKIKRQTNASVWGRSSVWAIGGFD
ncbi:hypothetical protein QBC38DRAFT_446681 [Podospora fimiseda]|uniref:Uncharacterized protein n=1 Tax=Podospora fimiseda TaxID=252190 RepID=A0AAN7BIN3_9PEZI|nr:hypothetical protein QBC38DRAFT_446681 [Podospora fimiseda]